MRLITMLLLVSVPGLALAGGFEGSSSRPLVIKGIVAEGSDTPAFDSVKELPASVEAPVAGARVQVFTGWQAEGRDAVGGPTRVRAEVTTDEAGRFELPEMNLRLGDVVTFAVSEPTHHAAALEGFFSGGDILLSIKLPSITDGAACCGGKTKHLTSVSRR